MEILGKIKGGISQVRERAKLLLTDAQKKVRAYLAGKDAKPQKDAAEEREETMPLFEEEGSHSIKERVKVLKVEIIARARNFWKDVKEQYVAFEGRLTPRERVAFLLVAGAALGIGIKLIATEYVTMGYYDYTGSDGKTYDLIEMQKKVAEEGKTGAFSGGVGNAGACSL